MENVFSLTPGFSPVTKLVRRETVDTVSASGVLAHRVKTPVLICERKVESGNGMGEAGAEG